MAPKRNVRQLKKNYYLMRLEAKKFKEQLASVSETHESASNLVPNPTVSLSIENNIASSSVSCTNNTEVNYGASSSVRNFYTSGIHSATTSAMINRPTETNSIVGGMDNLSSGSSIRFRVPSIDVNLLKEGGNSPSVPSLSDKPKEWYNKFNVSLASFKGLLTILGEFHDLPNDIRTILCSESLPCAPIGEGSFPYIGLKKCITANFQAKDFTN